MLADISSQKPKNIEQNDTKESSVRTRTKLLPLSSTILNPPTEYIPVYANNRVTMSNTISDDEKWQMLSKTRSEALTKNGYSQILGARRVVIDADGSTDENNVPRTSLSTNQRRKLFSSGSISTEFSFIGTDNDDNEAPLNRKSLSISDFNETQGMYALYRPASFGRLSDYQVESTYSNINETSTLKRSQRVTVDSLLINEFERGITNQDYRSIRLNKCSTIKKVKQYAAPPTTGDGCYDLSRTNHCSIGIIGNNKNNDNGINKTTGNATVHNTDCAKNIDDQIIGIINTAVDDIDDVTKCDKKINIQITDEGSSYTEGKNYSY